MTQAHESTALHEQFLGIDLAGDSGTTGVAVITQGADALRYSFPSGNWKEAKGLLRLKELVLGSTEIALDQPFSYPAATMRLLVDAPSATGGDDVSAFCSRRTDTAMREMLNAVGLAADYVMSPNRCQNVWRALALAKLCGFTRRDVCLCSSRLVETHPRVAWTVVLAAWVGKEEARRLVETYKGESRTETQRIDSRKTILSVFEKEAGITPAGAGPEAAQGARAEAWDSDNKFEALICAYVAYLRPRGATMMAGFTTVPSGE